MPNLVKKFQNTVFENNLFEREDKIILGVSGGPDSVCMLDVFSKLQKKYSLELIVSHINYGLRGDDSERDEKFVRKLAEKYGLEIFVLRPVEVPAYRTGRQLIEPLRKKYSSEDTLRDIRYDFFEKIRKGKRFDFIAVAHNADDQVETFLMRIIRGTGMNGLSAMRPKNKNIIRPLLDISRDEITKYLKKSELKYRIDKTNLESKYLRNKIRNKLLPILEKDFNPNIRKTILGSVRSIGEDAHYLQRETLKKLEKEDSRTFSVSKILKNHPAIQRRLLLEIIKKEKEDSQNTDSSQIREIIKILKSTKSKRQIVLGRKLKIERIGDKLKIEKIK